MDLGSYRPSIGLVCTGLALWLAGLLLAAFVPVVAAVGVVLVTVGQILFWIGLGLLLVQFVRSLF